MHSLRARVSTGLFSLLIALTLLAPSRVAYAEAINTSFTYQGRILLDGAALTASISTLSFKVYDAGTAGNLLVSPVSAINSTDQISAGYFMAKLDFAGDVFRTGEKRWIEVTYTPATGSPVTFSRQEITATPQSTFASEAAKWTGTSVQSVSDARNALQLGVTATPTFSTLTLTGSTGTPLVVNGGTLTVHAGNNRVGVNTTTPADALEVVGDAIRLRPSYGGGGSWNYLKLLSGATGRSTIQLGSAGSPTTGQISYDNNSANPNPFSLDTNGTVRAIINNWSMSLYHAVSGTPAGGTSEYVGSLIVNQSGSPGYAANTTLTANATFDGAHFHYGHTDSSVSKPFWGLTLDGGEGDQFSLLRAIPQVGTTSSTGSIMPDASLKEKLRVDRTGSLFLFASTGTDAPTNAATGSAEVKLYAAYMPTGDNGPSGGEGHQANAVLYAQDGSGARTQLTSHADPRMLIANLGASGKSKYFGKSNQTTDTLTTSFSDADVVIPWSFHHNNPLIGKGSIVDMAKIAKWAEEQMMAQEGEDGRAIFTYDLPPEQTIKESDYLDDMAIEAVNQALHKMGAIEVALGANGELPADAWEEKDIYVDQEVTEDVVTKEIDWSTARLVEVHRQVTKKISVSTGQQERKLKDGYVLRDGAIYRQPTIEDVDIDAIPDFEIPAWVEQRVDSGNAAKSIHKTTQLRFRDRLERQVAIMRNAPASKVNLTAEPRAVALGK